MDGDNEYAMIDSTIVRTRQHAAGARKKGVRTPKTSANKKPSSGQKAD